MPRAPEEAATIAATSLMTWNAVWSLVLPDFIVGGYEADGWNYATTTTRVESMQESCSMQERGWCIKQKMCHVPCHVVPAAPTPARSKMARRFCTSSYMKFVAGDIKNWFSSVHRQLLLPPTHLLVCRSTVTVCPRIFKHTYTWQALSRTEEKRQSRSNNQRFESQGRGDDREKKMMDFFIMFILQ